MPQSGQAAAHLLTTSTRNADCAFETEVTLRSDDGAQAADALIWSAECKPAVTQATCYKLAPRLNQNRISYNATPEAPHVPIPEPEHTAASVFAKLPCGEVPAGDIPAAKAAQKPGRKRFLSNRCGWGGRSQSRDGRADTLGQDGGLSGRRCATDQGTFGAAFLQNNSYVRYWVSHLRVASA